MCEHDESLTIPTLNRRSLLAAAAALGGGAALSPTPAFAREDGGEHADRHGDVPAEPLVAPPLVLRGGTVLDPADGRVTENAVVVLARGRVQAVGTNDRTRHVVQGLGGDATVIDVSGRWVLPGLIDVHVHINALADAAGVLRAGATSVRSGSSTFFQDVALRELPDWVPGVAPRMRAAGVFVTPDLGDTVLADPALAPLATLAGGVRSLEALRYLTQVNLDRGVDVVKTRTNERAGLPEQDPLVEVYGRDQVRAIVEQARRGGAAVLSHSYTAQGCDNAVRAGVRSLEHGVYVTEATLAEMRRRGTYFTPTTRAIADLANSPNPILAERGRTFLPVLKEAIRTAHAMGVSVVAGTDTFGTATRPIGTEVVLIGSAGVPALDAIRGATTTAARLLGIERRAGRLARGFFADVVVTDTSPLDDLGALAQLKLVVAQGAVVRNDLAA